MRPDERLLVPVACLPFVPRGALLWLDANSPCVASSTQRWSSGALLDISAPALRDGIPERLDVLPWALGVLGWKWEEVTPYGCREFVPPEWGGADPAKAGRWRVQYNRGVDLSDLTDDDSARAVVAAALRQRGAR